jgi:hypothetical protein
VNNLSADSAPTDQETLVDEVLNRAPNCRATEVQPFAEGNLVLEARSGGEVAVHDGLLDALLDLKVQGDWAVSVEVRKERGHY